MKTFKYVNMFNHGVTEVQDALRENENPPAEFNVNLVTAFSAIVRDEGKTYEESIKDVNLDIACTQLKSNCSEQLKALIISFEDREMSAVELQLGPLLGPRFKDVTNRLFKKKALYPALELNLIAQTHPESPRHPQQKYYLTELGKALQRKLKEEQ